MRVTSEQLSKQLVDMALLSAALLFLLCPVLTRAEGHEENRNHMNGVPEGALRVLLEITPGFVVYSDVGTIRVEKMLAAQAGVIFPVWKMLALECLVGHEIGTTTAFDRLLHGPVAASYFMTRLGLFSIGPGLTGGVDFDKVSFQGGWLGLSTKFTIELGHNLEVGGQAGPRVHFSSEATKWGADGFAVLAFVL